MAEFGPGLEIKQIDGDGSISGLAAAYGNVDLGNDVFLPGSASKSLAGIKSVPMLLYHDQQKPVGVWDHLSDGAEGVAVKGRFAMSTIAGREAHAMAKDGALPALSVGYKSLVDFMAGKVRNIREWTLFEVSLVTIGMNPKALVDSVKAAALNDLRAKLAAGDRLETREMEELFKEHFGFSNSEAERAVRAAMAGEQGGPAETDPAQEFWAAMRAAEIVDLTGEPD